MIKLIIYIFCLIILASIVRCDACTCGQGKKVRQTLKQTFGSSDKEEALKK